MHAADRSGQPGRFPAPAEIRRRAAGEGVLQSAGECREIHTAGLPPGREKGLFEKFTRGREGSAVAGVSLGRAIVRAIVQAHKGTVRAEIRPEGGARFVITLSAGETPVVSAAE